MTATPEFRPLWGARSHHGTISLVPLDRGQVRHMIEAVAARHVLPKEVSGRVTERTGGVPLFVEEGDSSALGARRARRHPGDLPVTILASLCCAVDGSIDKRTDIQQANGFLLAQKSAAVGAGGG